MAPKGNTDPKDLSRIGWRAADFGITTPAEVQRNVSGLATGPNIIGTPPQGTTYITPQAPKQSLIATTAETPQISWDTRRQAAAYFLDPFGFVTNAQENQAAFEQATQMQQSPLLKNGLMAYTAGRTATASFFSNLFNVDDEKENVVETVWDGFLKGFQYPYQKLEQLTVAGLSALPGGTRTFTWDEAEKTSVGQMLVAAPGISVGKVRRGEGSLGDIFNAYLTPMGWAGMAAGAIDPDTKVQQQGFDLLSSEGQAAMSTGWEKFFSGIGDVGFMFADPLIVAGAAGKAARIRWVDKPIVSELDRTVLRENLAKDNALIQQGTPEKASPVGQFVHWATEKDANGVKIRKVGEIYNHPVIRDAADRDVLTSAMFATDNFEDGALIMRSVYGDIEARKALFAKRADLAVEIGQANRKLIADKIRADPSTKATTVAEMRGVLKEKQAIVDQYEKQFRRTTALSGAVEPPALFKARADLLRAQENLAEAQAVRISGPVTRPMSRADLQMTKKVLDDLIARDRALAKGLDDALMDTLATPNHNFSANNPLGRLVERSRQRRATARYEAQATQGRGIWRKDEYFQTNRFIRAVRVWRWMGGERPAGYIPTKGASASDAGREIAATLNTLKLYSGTGKTVMVEGKPVTVGGIARKEELMNQFFATVGSGVRDQDIMQKTLLGFEEAVFKDIGAYYGLDAKVVRQTLNSHSIKRAELVEQIRNRGYWAEQNADDTISIEKAPWLESQLENGMYMMDFRQAERLADTATSQGARKKWRASYDLASDKLNVGYEAFNALWRPAVLLRLGYTQRNVSEGLFRSIAYLSSLRPLADASKEMYYGVRNPIVRKQTEKEIARTEQALAAGKQLDDLVGTKFSKWRKTELEALDGRIAREQEWFDNMTDQLKSSGLSRIEADDIYKTMFAQERVLTQMRAKKELLLTDNGALALYRKQGNAGRRVYDGLLSTTDPIPWRNAFNNESDYTPIALANASADNTTKQMIQLRNDAQLNLLKRTQRNEYAAITPDKGDEYWNAVADQLTTFRSSELGQLILNGADARDLARFLRSDRTGREIASFITGGKKWDVTTGIDEAQNYAQDVIDRFMILAPDENLRRFMQSRITVGARRADAPITGADVKRFLDDPKYRDQLQPVIGSMDEIVGHVRVRDLYQQGVQAAFKWLGTIPEDSLVRFPFYGQIYERNLKVVRNRLMEQYGDKIPLTEVNRAIMSSHKRALRDTKAYLFTIERRTNLADRGEMFAPFLQATQNSLTSVGRLIWKDPALPFVMENIWNMPQVMGIENENGELVVPIPHDWIPDNLEDLVGLSSMDNFYIDKKSLNTIFPETGYGFLPRPSPLVMIPASMMMQKNFLFTVNPPQVFVDVLGEETANAVWEQGKSYMFGEEGGMSVNPATLVLPPDAQKAVQIWQGFGSKEYVHWYNQFYRVEMLKLNAGQRGPIDKQEIINKTNWFTGLRMLANRTAFTPPRYESKLQPLMDAIRTNDQLYGQRGPIVSAQQFGPILESLGDFSTSRNVAGVEASAQAVARTRRYSNIISNVAPSIDKTSLSALSIILNPEVPGYYDESAYAWQYSNQIPGISENFRELQSPEESLRQSQKNAGWTIYIKAMDQVKAIADQRGLKSYKKDPGLVQFKKDLVAKLTNDPNFEGWAQDYEDPTSMRTQDTVRILDAAMRDEQFLKDNMQSPIWQAARRYLETRKTIAQLVAESGKPTINSPGNERIKQAWDDIRESLITEYNGWGTVANRWLTGDDSPKPLRETFAMQRSE